MNKVTLLFVVIAALVLSMAFVSAAAVPGEASITNETDLGKYVFSSGDQNINLESGNITYVDIDTNMSTYRWSGLLGNVSGNIILGDSGGDVLFQWAAQGRVVYATESGAPAWASLVIANNSIMADYINGTDSDNFTNTFNETGTVDSGIFTLTNAPRATTFGGTGWYTYALYDGTNSIFAGNVRSAGDTGYNSQSVQYQMIVPEDGRLSDATATQYNLWVELI